MNPDIQNLFETFINTYYNDKIIPDFIYVPFEFE